MKIWLDDLRLPPDNSWYWCKSYEEFKDAILYHWGDPEGWTWESGDYAISFDHDLGYDYDLDYTKGFQIVDGVLGKTGYDCAKFLIDMHIEGRTGWPDYWHVHSANPVGAENIRKLLENYEKHIKET